MAKTRDMLFVERQIGEADVERAIERYNLQSEEAFKTLMGQHEERMKEL